MYMSLATVLLIGAVLGVVLLIICFLTMSYKRIMHTGEALVITRYGSVPKEAVLNGAFVWPKINNYERMDITRRKIDIVREGAKGKTGEQYEGLHCLDNIRANLRVTFYIGVNPDPKDILLVADNLTCEGASNIATLEAHLSPKFSEALKTVIKRFEFEELYTARDRFRDEVKSMLQNELEGFKLYDVVIDKIEQTPLDAHDPDNVLDADGIRKISQTTSLKNIETAQIRQHELTETKKRNSDGETSRLHIERALAEETERNQREIKEIRIEQNKNVVIKEEQAKLEMANERIKTEQSIEISEQNKEREVEVARINNDKVVNIQREQVTRATEVERVTTEREVLEQNIGKEKYEEGERKEIATIVAIRTRTEREIAVEQEQTKDIRTKSEADRGKLVIVTQSEATAQAEAVKKVTLSEAELNASKNTVAKNILEADSQLVVATKGSEAKERLAEANRKEQSAGGLAQADVRERLSEVEIKEASAKAAQVREVGLAEVEVKSKDADAIEKQGKAEAVRVREIGLAEAASSEAQYKAMGAIEPEVRQHEIDKLNIDKDKEIQIASIRTQEVIASKNAEVMAAAMSKADIKMIGGGDMFDSLRKGILAGQTIDQTLENSDALKGIFGKYASGEKDLVSELSDVLKASDVSTGDVGTLVVAKAIADLVGKAPGGAALLQQLVGSVKKS